MHAEPYPLPVIHVGWHAVDPGPAPRSPLLDRVPNTADPRAHERWRGEVEAEDADLLAIHQQRPVWFPVQRSATDYIIPVFGGRVGSWRHCVATLSAALIRAGFLEVRVANLSRLRVLDELQRLSAHRRTAWRTEFHVLSGFGSTINPVPVVGLDEMAVALSELAAPDLADDPLRPGSLQTALLRVGQHLAAPVKLEALGRALQLVLTGSVAPGTRFATHEEQALRRLHAEMRHRPTMRSDLELLERVVCMAWPYRKTRRAQSLGAGQLKVHALEIDATETHTRYLVARRLSAFSVVRSFARPAPPSTEALILAGADCLSDDDLAQLLASAETHSKQLVLLFEHLTARTQEYLGAGGTQTAVFFALPNAEEAKRAAEHLGHEYKFVVNGYSVSEGSVKQWSMSHTVSSDTNTNETLTYGRDFSRSIAKGTARGEAEASEEGGSRSRETGTTRGRVHEYVVAPEQFQDIPDNLMLVVQGKQVTLADCRPSIRTLPITAGGPHELPPR